MLALFYDFLGMMTHEILSLRLIETLVGAAIGAAVAFFIFPVRTRAMVQRARARLVHSLERVIEKLGRPDVRARDLAHELRQVDQDLADLRLAAGPFEGRMALAQASEVPRVLFDASSLVHDLKRVAAEANAPRTTPHSPKATP